MSGRTGKMTAEAVAARGPRFILTSVFHCEKFIGFVIRKEGPEGMTVFNQSPSSARLLMSYHRFTFATYAKSYSLKYLLQIGQSGSQAIHL